MFIERVESAIINNETNSYYDYADEMCWDDPHYQGTSPNIFPPVDPVGVSVAPLACYESEPEEMDPLAADIYNSSAIDGGATDYLLGELGLNEAEDSLTAYLSTAYESEAADDNARQNVLDQFASIFDTLAYIEYAYADLPGMAERCQALRDAVRDRLLELTPGLRAQHGTAADELLAEINAELDAAECGYLTMPEPAVGTVVAVENDPDGPDLVLPVNPGAGQLEAAEAITEAPAPAPEEETEAAEEPTSLPISLFGPAPLNTVRPADQFQDNESGTERPETRSARAELNALSQQIIEMTRDLYERTIDRITRYFRERQPGDIIRENRLEV
ncbi:MAG: hypothetical protein JW782_08200 [Candidatus Saganbacteria bacterium]|nr:hypothetical protein [Candidatus Saganbacteria bacterium]